MLYEFYLENGDATKKLCILSRFVRVIPNSFSQRKTLDGPSSSASLLCGSQGSRKKEDTKPVFPVWTLEYHVPPAERHATGLRKV